MTTNRWKLAGVRIESAGPRAARFDRPSADADPFILDFRGLNGQPSDSVMWLENGGGKTVLLALMFHVLSPQRADTIGIEDGKKRSALRELIGLDDVGQIAIELESDDGHTTSHLIVGRTVERRPTGTRDDIPKSFWKVRTDGSLKLADLPFTANGKRLRTAAFKEALSKMVAGLGRRRATVEWAESNTAWVKALDDVGVDPALIAYQITMNRKESGATSLFKFRSDQDFLRFLYDLTLDPARLAAAGDELARVSTEVAELPGLELEADWIASVLAHLGPLAKANQLRLDATERIHTLTDEADELAAAVDAATQSARRTMATAKEEAAVREADRVAADRDRRAADAGRGNANRWTSHRRADLARSVANDARTEAARMSIAAEAWRSVHRVVAHQNAAAAFDAAEAAYSTAEAEADPLRRKRDEAGSHLRGRLADDARQARLTAETATAGAENAKSREAELREAANEDRLAADRDAQKAANLRKALKAYEELLDQLVRDDLIDLDRNPVAALTRIDRALANLDIEEANAREKRQELLNRQELLGPALRDADTKATEARKSFDEIDARLTSARQERDRFNHHRRLIELAETDDAIDLDAIGVVLTEALTAAAQRSRREQLEIVAAAAAGRRSIASIETERLLPARPEVEYVVAVLREAGVDANSGWRWLAEAARPDARDRVIARWPHLVDGVIVTNRDDISRAASALTTTVVPAAVAVAAADLLAAAENSPDGTDAADEAFLVTAAPGLWDEDAAAAAGSDLSERIAKSDDAITIAHTAELADIALRDNLESHLEAWPPGALATLRANAEQHAEAAGGAQEHADDLRAQSEECRAELDNLATKAETRSNARGDLDRRRRRVAPAAADAEQLAGAVDEAADAERTAAASTRQAIDSERDAGLQVEKRLRCSGEARDAKALAATADANRAVIDAPVHPTESDETAAPPHGSVVELTGRFTAADQLWREATVGSDAAVALGEARKILTRCVEEMNLLAAEVCALAIEYAQRSEAGDPGGRDRAQQRADEEHRLLSEVAQEAEGAARLAEGKATDAGPPAADAGLEVLNVDTLQELGDWLSAVTEDAYRRQQAAEDRIKALGQQAQDSEQAEALLGGQLASLRSSFPGAGLSIIALPFTGDAVARVSELLASYGEARGRRDNANEDIATHAAGVAETARAPEYDRLDQPVHRRLRTAPAAELATDAARLAEQLELLGDQILARVDDLGAHRELLVTSMADLADAAVSVARMTESLSRLPDNLGDWSKQPFIKIRLEAPHDAEAKRTRIRQLVNRLIDDRAAGRDLPTEAALAVTAALAVAERDPLVRVLKPSRARAREWVPITEMASLSGGMRATAAIAMFCTLAAVRARNHRGGGGLGTLILDNPFGDANANYLVSLQRQMASQSDVQLVYASGIGDPDTLAEFPVTIRLANRIARGGARQYVTITGHKVDLDAHPSPMATARLVRDQLAMPL